MTVYYLCWINDDRRAGGVRVLYQQVDALNAAGRDAAVVHARPGFRCSWFRNETRVVHPPFDLVPGDLLALPEALASRLDDIAPGVPKVVINQNAHYTWDGVPLEDEHPYVTSRDLLAVACISEHNRSLLQMSFADLPIARLRYHLDFDVFHPQVGGPTGRRIAYMPRKRAEDAKLVLGMLSARGDLEDWEVVALDGLNEAGVADALRSCRLFLSFSEREGCPVPPLEALASGCHVIGYTGYGGQEYFDERYTTAVDDGDVQGFVLAVGRWLRDEPAVDAAGAAAHARSLYSRQLSEASVVDFYRQLDDRVAHHGRRRRLSAADTLLTPRPGPTRDWARGVLRAVAGRAR